MTRPVHTACAVRELARARDLLSFVPALRTGREAWLLDSALAAAPLGRFSFAGADPYLVLTTDREHATLDVRRAAHPGLSPGIQERTGDPLTLLRELLPPAPASLDPRVASLPFAGGVVGCFGYELAAGLEPIRFAPRTERSLPDLVLLFVDRLLALDHRTGNLLALGLGFGHDEAEAGARAEGAVDELLARLDPARNGGAHAAPHQRRSASPMVCVSPAAYVARVSEAKARIEAGDVYQVCLTHRIDLSAAVEPWKLYTALRRLSPAPFAAYLELEGVSVISSSPERFLRLDAAGCAETRPIKGTRPRGDTPEEDAKQRAELAASAKDRAENVMIVDLARNDLGRVCETGSIAVTELCAIEAYATLYQLVSTVRGKLAPGRDALDLLRAAFPPGSMTGAPKLSAMRILDRLEPARRGFYAGALGYLDLRGGMDLSVVIRTILLREGRAELHVGGGIVADSDPLAEYQESMDKAAALLAALADADEAAEPEDPTAAACPREGAPARSGPMA
jgi:aminodeoxychorismate synthase component I